MINQIKEVNQIDSLIITSPNQFLSSNSIYKNYSTHKKRVVSTFIMILLFIFINSSMAYSENSSYMNLTLPILCGNGMCELGENSDNCPIDCSIFFFDYSLDSSTNQIVYPGNNITIGILLSNRLNETNEILLEIKGDLSNFMVPSIKDISLDKGQSKPLELSISIPSNSSPGIISGYIELTSRLVSSNIPFNINIKEKRKNIIELDLNIINDEITSQNNLSFEYNVIYHDVIGKDLTLNVSIVNAETKELIYSYPLYFKYQINSKKQREEIALYNKSLLFSDGSYQLNIKTESNGTEVNSYKLFYIKNPFWTFTKLIILFSIIILIVLLIGGFYTYKRYMQYKRENSRYVLPDVSKLPKSDEKNYSVGILAEINKKAYFNPADLTTHALVAGSTGSGKSVTASVIVEEALLKNVAVVVFDPTSQWTGFVKQCTDKNLLMNYKKFNLHEDEARSFKGLIYNVTSPDVKIDLMKYLNPGEVTVFNLSQLKPGQYDLAVQAIVDTVFSIKWNESSELKYLFVFDEVHRLLEKYGGSGGYIALEKACREFRKWGIGIIMVSQVSSDFKEVIAGNILTEIQLNTKNIEDIKKIQQKHGVDYSSKITRLGIGVGMIQNPRYNNGKPWFVQFRPTLHNPHSLTDTEIDTYTNYANRISVIELMLRNAKLNSIDIEDISLELKLIKNKLKEGKFKIVKMYLDTISEKLNKKVNPKT